MSTHSGALLKQIVYSTNGFSNYVAKVDVTATTGNANTIITDVGLLWVTTPASVSVELQDPADTWNSVVAASQTLPVLIPSDGMNLRVHSADTSTNRAATYYLIQ